MENLKFKKVDDALKAALSGVTKKPTLSIVKAHDLLNKYKNSDFREPDRQLKEGIQKLDGVTVTIPPVEKSKPDTQLKGAKPKTYPKEKKYYQTDDFLELKRTWYLKLKEAGFEDLEVTKSGKIEHEYLIRPKEFTDKDCVKEFMKNRNREILERYSFKHPVYREIFNLHADGLQASLIHKFLVDNGRKPLKKRSIDDLILKIKEDFRVNYPIEENQ